jgi:hypothetical protein
MGALGWLSFHQAILRLLRLIQECADIHAKDLRG